MAGAVSRFVPVYGTIIFAATNIYDGGVWACDYFSNLEMNYMRKLNFNPLNIAFGL